MKNTDTRAFTFKTFLAIGKKKKKGAFKNTKIKCHFTVGKLLSESDRMKVHSKRGRGGGGRDKGRLSSSQQFQFARKLKVTKKYWANCRIHARMRKKIKNNFLFKVG